MWRADDKAQSLFGSESMPVVAVTSVHDLDHQKPPSAYYNDDDLQMSSGRWGTTTGGVSEIEEEEEEEGHGYASRRQVFDFKRCGGLDSIREGEDLRRQVVGCSELEGPAGSDRASTLFSFDFHDGESEDAAVYYVALVQGGQQGNGSSKGAADQDSASMDALLWTLNHAAANHHPTALLFLVHVFPEIKHIPTPLGKMPVSQVNPEQKEIYMAQERDRRREFLNKFLNACSSVAKVKVDTILIESDMEGKAILDLVSILNIRLLVLGTTKAILGKIRSGRRSASGVIDQIVKGAPEFCEVKVICEGQQMLDLITRTSPSATSPAPSPSPSPRGTYSNNNNHASLPMHTPQRSSSAADHSFSCGCFRPKVQS